MPVVLSLLGIVLGLVGGGLLYVFHDPRFGDSLVLESAKPERDRIGARAGLALVVIGSGLQFAAVVVAS